jgi:hypothetical protein
MANLHDFDAEQVDPNTGFDPIPEGKYLATIAATEMRETKDRTGRYLEVVHEVLEGPYKGRRLWARLNLENPNADSVRIARAQLSAVCRAVGVLRPKDSVELHGLPHLLDVRLRKRKDTGDLVNEIRGWHPKATAATQAAGAAPGAAPLTAVAGDRPPWAR